MGDKIKVIELGVWKDWITPAEALVRAAPRVGGTYRAKEFVAEHVADGLVQAAAANVIINDRYGTPEEQKADSVLVRSTDMRLLTQVDSNPIWDKATAEVWLERGEKRIKYYGIRIDPEALESRLPPLPGKIQVYAMGEPENEAPLDQKPELPAALLDAWFDLFKKTYKEDGLTEAKASKSVAGMFPDHSVTRARIRALLPERKRGRPSKRDG